MAHLIRTPATRTDPADCELVITNDEILEEVERIIIDEGASPAYIYLTDEYTDELIEVEVDLEADSNDIIDLERKHKVGDYEDEN